MTPGSYCSYCSWRLCRMVNELTVWLALHSAGPGTMLALTAAQRESLVTVARR